MGFFMMSPPFRLLVLILLFVWMSA